MAVDVKTSLEILKVYKRRVRRVSVIPDEIVFEILLRLPVKALMRFKSVSKSWHAIISNPCFIRLHLKQSAKNQGHKPSFLITPHTLDKVIDGEAWPTTFSNHTPFYSWQEGQDNACLVHSTTFQGEFGSVYDMVHCDGLVLLLTDTNVYVFNPAIHQVLKLRDGQEDVWQFPTVGLGLDPRTNTYKVARYFYRSLDFSKKTYSVGMEILTIGGHDDDLCWRSVAQDPPLPFDPGSVTHFKGSLYLLIWDELVERRPQGVLRFNLEDETFSFIWHNELLSPKGERLYFVELGGELCLVQCFDGKQVIWMLQFGDGHQWVQQYVIILPEPEPWKFGILSVIRKDVLLIRSGNCLYHYHVARQDARVVVRLDRLRYKNPGVGSFDFVGQDIFIFDMLSYTESLLQVTKPGRDNTCWLL
ncbi:putative F-box protein At4g09190 [Triticum dicoccoides]|uniref:putative F-box protein At4g09190 n=1 Tax=Triticum dicoccoides TaxID=85692 RepID=UPI000E7A4DA2|nr:putative F-box protein At4g09190 [Triticum dicoccoides]